MDARAIKGFTIIELVIIILIIGVLAVTLTLTWPGTQITSVAMANQVASDLQMTQSFSMTRGTRYCLVFGASSYQVIASNTGAAVTFPFGNTTATLSSGLAFGSLSGIGMIVFDGKGVPYSSSASTCNSANAAAATALATNTNIPITGGGQTSTVVITPQTGRVIVQ